MRLDKFITRSRVVDLASADQEGALEELLNLTVDRFPDLDKDVLLKGLMRRVPAGERVNPPAAIRPLRGKAQMRVGSALVEGEFQPIESHGLSGRLILEGEPAARDANMLEFA